MPLGAKCCRCRWMASSASCGRAVPSASAVWAAHGGGGNGGGDGSTGSDCGVLLWQGSLTVQLPVGAILGEMALFGGAANIRGAD